MTPTDHVRRFVDELAVPRRGPLPCVPKSHRVDPSDESEWTEWLALPSPVTGQHLDALETEFDILMPSVLRQYFTHIQMLDGDFGLIRMPDMDANSPLSGLQQQIAIINSHDIFREQGYLPFVQDGNDGGPLCFKCDEQKRVADAPVFVTVHGF